jgi:RNA polymerase-binding protein DksA
MAETPKRTDLDFHEFRKRLLAERDRLLALHQHKRADILAESADSSENELGSYSTFDAAENADTAFMLSERDRDEILDANERELLRQVEAALTRLDAGTYGICEVTGKPIPVERLRALPWASTIVEAAE